MSDHEPTSSARRHRRRGRGGGKPEASHRTSADNEGRGRDGRSGGRRKGAELPAVSRACAPLVDIGANLTVRVGCDAALARAYNQQNKRFARDLGAVLERSSAANVGHILITGTSLKATLDARKMVTAGLGGPVRLAYTAGVHPHDAKHCDAATIGRLRSLFTDGEVAPRAVGECGLDYNRMFSPREQQLECFRQHIRLALDLHRPMFCHERDAHSDFLRVCDEFPSLPPIVVHCFTGTEAEARAYVDRGFYVGFTGTVCMHERGAPLRALLSAGAVPLHRIMIETDAPFMSPLRKVRRNEPFLLPLVVSCLSQCLEVSEEDVAAHTTSNALEFFTWSADEKGSEDGAGPSQRPEEEEGSSSSSVYAQ